jgi:hypothetical protein
VPDPNLLYAVTAAVVVALAVWVALVLKNAKVAWAEGNAQGGAVTTEKAEKNLDAPKADARESEQAAAATPDEVETRRDRPPSSDAAKDASAPEGEASTEAKPAGAPGTEDKTEPKTDEKTDEKTEAKAEDKT